MGYSCQTLCEGTSGPDAPLNFANCTLYAWPRFGDFARFARA
jgi:hypothetical protein